MRRQATSSIWNTRPQSSRWFFVPHKPKRIAALQVSAAPDTYPASAVDIINVLSGATSDVKAGKTILIGGSKLRVRRDLTASGSLLQIAEAGSGLVTWQATSTLSILDQYLPWVKHPYYNLSTSQWQIDYDEAYSNQLELYGPYVNMGPPVVGELDANGKFAASFYGLETLGFEAGVQTFQWDFPDGQQVLSKIGSSDSPIVMTFTGASPGGSYVSLRVTDASGSSHIGHRLIWVFDDIESQAPRVQIGSIFGGAEDGGYTAQVLAVGGDFSDIPDGGEFVIFEKASYGPVRTTPHGGNGYHRDGIVFRGWLTNEVDIINPMHSVAQFTGRTIDGVLGNMDSYDVFMDLASSGPTGGSHWVEASALSLDRVALHILKNRTTAGNLTDFTPLSGLGLSEHIEYQSLPRGPLWEQLRMNYGEKGVLGFFASDMQSGLHAFHNPQMTGGSAALPIQLHLNSNNLRDVVQIMHPHQAVNSQTRLYAVSGETPLGAESPAKVLGYGGGAFSHDQGLLVDSQQTLINWAGNKRAEMNNPYPHVMAPVVGNVRLDAVPIHRVTMSLSSTDNNRGLSWNDKPFYQRRLTLTYNPQAGHTNADIEMQAIVNGIGGSSIDFPPTIVPVPPADPPDNPTTPVVPNTQGQGFGTVYVSGNTSLWRTSAFSASSPTYTNIAGFGGSAIRDFILDPWNLNSGYAATDNGIYKSTNIKASSPTWAQVFSSSTAATLTGETGFQLPYKIIASINLQDYVGFAYTMSSSAKIFYAYSTDGGDTWAGSTLNNNTTHGFYGALDYVPHLISGQVVLYAACWQETPDDRAKIMKSTDSGATWSEVFSAAWLSVFSSSAGTTIHCPYHDNSDGSKVYAVVQDIFGSQRSAVIYYSTNGGTSWTQITSNTVGNGTFRARRHAVETHPENSNLAWYWRDDNILMVSTTGPGGTFSAKSCTGLSGSVKAAGGFPFTQGQYYVVTTAGVYVSTDGGDNFTNKTGNITDLPTDVTAVENMRGTIVPDWTE